MTALNKMTECLQETDRCRRTHPKRYSSLRGGRVRRGLVWVLGLVAAGGVPTGGQESLRLPFGEARELALARNAQLRAGASDVDAARAAHLRAWAGLLPHISLSESAVRSNDAVGVFGTKLRQERFAQEDFALGALNRPGAINGFRTTLEVRQPLMDWGALYARRQAAEGVRGARAGLRRSRQAVVLETAEAYWALCLARAGLHSARRGVEEAEAFAGAAEARLRAETATRVDVLAGQARLAQRRARQAEADETLAAAEDRLTLVLGLGVATRLVGLDSLDALYEPKRGMNTDERMVRRALGQRPDLEGQEAALAAAGKALGAAKAAFVPRLDAFARADLDADAPFARQGESWSAGVVLRWDLFDGLDKVGALRQARARLERSEAERAWLAARVEREVRAARRAVDTARARVELGNVAHERAEEAWRISRKRYAQGLATAAEVLAAEAEASQARLGRLQALYGFNVALSALEFAMGEPVE